MPAISDSKRTYHVLEEPDNLTCDLQDAIYRLE